MIYVTKNVFFIDKQVASCVSISCNIVSLRSCFMFGSMAADVNRNFNCKKSFTIKILTRASNFLGRCPKMVVLPLQRHQGLSNKK